MTAGFDEFWRAYPRKVGKLAAVKLWQRLHPDLTQVLAALQWQTQQQQWQDLNYVPHPKTWLSQGRWLDEPPFSTLRSAPCSGCGAPEPCVDIKVCNARWLAQQREA